VWGNNILHGIYMLYLLLIDNLRDRLWTLVVAIGDHKNWCCTRTYSYNDYKDQLHITAHVDQSTEFNNKRAFLAVAHKTAAVVTRTDQVATTNASNHRPNAPAGGGKRVAGNNWVARTDQVAAVASSGFQPARTDPVTTGSASDRRPHRPAGGKKQAAGNNWEVRTDQVAAAAAAAASAGFWPTHTDQVATANASDCRPHRPATSKGADDEHEGVHGPRHGSNSGGGQRGFPAHAHGPGSNSEHQ
jgi:hypothetical protein